MGLHTVIRHSIYYMQDDGEVPHSHSHSFVRDSVCTSFHITARVIEHIQMSRISQ